VVVVGEASDGDTAIEAADRLRPAVVIMDINMPKMSGIEATIQIKSRFPDMHIIGLSMATDEHYQQAMQQAGAARLLTKESAVDQLYSAIQWTVGHAHPLSTAP
jgi:DNA-binding NarL/FixJ family response regulator